MHSFHSCGTPDASSLAAATGSGLTPSSLYALLGVEDDGYPKGLEGPDLQASLSTLHFMAAALGAHVQLVRQMPGAFGRICALARVRRETPNQVRATLVTGTWVGTGNQRSGQGAPWR